MSDKKIAQSLAKDYKLPDPQHARSLIMGITVLRKVIGEKRVIALVRSNVDKREKLWGELLRETDPVIKEAVAAILTGLGLDPDEIVREAAEEQRGNVLSD